MRLVSAEDLLRGEGRVVAKPSLGEGVVAPSLNRCK
jgi:hypothetical protein